MYRMIQMRHLDVSRAWWRGRRLPVGGVLRLEVKDYDGPTRWRWVLKDETGAFIADHEVRLDEGSWQYEAFTDTAVVDRYLDRFSAGRSPAAGRGVTIAQHAGIGWPNVGEAGAAAVIMPVCEDKQSNSSRWGNGRP
jgi:hypothetical protein